MLSPLHCLLVDDDKDDQDIFMMALGDINKSITCKFANNSGEAITILKDTHQSTFDYIFLDLNMPKVNGKHCLQEIKQMPRFQHVPVVIYSTSTDPRDRIDTKRMGALDFISKPSDIDILAKLLADVFSQPQ